MNRKLKRTYTYGSLNLIPGFKKNFPEIKHVDNEELAQRFYKLGLDFYTEEKTKVSPLIRWTMPFAIITIILMFAGIPINFLFTGHWGYNLSKNNKLLNWFRALRLQ